MIKCNANRLRSVCYLLFQVHKTFRREVLERPDIGIKNPTLNSKQMSILLEFFLQIDGKYQYFIVIVDFFLFSSRCILYENMSISWR